MRNEDVPDWNKIVDDKGLSMSLIKKHTNLIHFFGLGFIQIKVSDTVRFHFYTPELPSITEDLHDHRYPFQSRILAGVLKQELWDLQVGTTHTVDKENCRPGRQSKGQGITCSVKLLMTSEHAAGTSYRITQDALHRVLPSQAITMVTRDLNGPLTETARVVRPVGAPRICPFSKQIPEAELWDIATKMAISYWG